MIALWNLGKCCGQTLQAFDFGFTTKTMENQSPKFSMSGNTLTVFITVVMMFARCLPNVQKMSKNYRFLQTYTAQRIEGSKG